MAGTEPASHGSDGRTSRADAIVVLGCRVHPSGRLTPTAAGRAAAAAAAFRAGLAPLVITSGGRRWGAQIEALALRTALVERGVPEASILTELWSFTTVENAVFTSALLRRRGARSALVVTCSWHIPRALEAFRAAGIESTGCPRAAVPGTFDRHAERFRRAYDALLFRGTALLSARADAFLSASEPLPAAVTSSLTPTAHRTSELVK